jgi:hypothetical protein
MAADPKEFEAIAPSLAIPHKWRDREVVIRPLKVGQIPGFAKAVGPILSSIPASSAGWGDMDIVSLIGTHGEALIAACAIAVPGIPETEIREAELDEFMALIADILSVNVDFFRRRMPQAAPKLAETLASLGDGSTLSKR